MISAIYQSPLFKQVVAAVACGLMTLASGLNNGFSSVLLPQLAADPDVVYNEEVGSWIASVPLIGMMVGGISAGFLLDELGRRIGNIVITFLIFLTWLVTGFANSIAPIFIFRFITAVVTGAIRPATIVYIGEISDSKYRGSFLLLPTFFLNLAVLIIHTVGCYLSWNYCAFVSSLVGFICFIFVLFLKESPLWMISRGQLEAGIERFKWLRGDTQEAEQELREVFEKVKNRKKRLTLIEKKNIICSKRFLKPYSLVICIFITLQFCGVNTLQFYAHDILKTSFGNTVSTFSLVMITDLIRIMSTIFVFILDKCLSRKITFIFSCYLTAFLLLSLSIYFFLEPIGFVWLSVLLIVMYVAFGSFLTAAGWSLVGEVFPGDIRGIASGFSSTTSYLTLFIVVKITPTVMSNLGHAALYAVNGIITLIATICITFMVPKTDGRTLQDIENSYSTKVVVEVTNNTRI